jgi:RNA polymerase sigma-70 factor (sigma-E family)
MDREEHFSAWALEASPQLLRVAQLLTGDEHAGEDLLQDVLARMYVKWARIDDPGPYARRALANAATSRWRRREHRHEVTRDLDDTDLGPEPARPLLRVEQRWDLLAVLRPLPARQRAVIVLRYLEDCSDEEVADLLDISVGTVKSQASRGLARLRLDHQPSAAQASAPQASAPQASAVQPRGVQASAVQPSPGAGGGATTAFHRSTTTCGESEPS